MTSRSRNWVVRFHLVPDLVFPCFGVVAWKESSDVFVTQKRVFQDCDHLSPLHCAAFRGHNGFCEKIHGCRLGVSAMQTSHMQSHFQHECLQNSQIPPQCQSLLRIVAHSSFKEACDAGVLKVASLRHARDDLWLWIGRRVIAQSDVRNQDSLQGSAHNTTASLGSHWFVFTTAQ